MRRRLRRLWRSGWHKVAPRDEADEQAQLAPFADAGVAGRIAKMIDADLDGEGATM